MAIKISTRGRYGLRALMDLAIHKDQEPVQLKDIAARQDISLRYLERLITPLISGGLIRTTRGAKGGVSLACQPAEIKLSYIFQVMEGPTVPVECITDPDTCNRSGRCATQDVWNDIKHAIDGVLGAMTLQDLIERQKAKDVTDVEMYHI